MLPVLALGPLEIPTYGLFVLAAFLVAAVVRRADVRRLGYDRHPAHVWVGVGGLLGAVVGSKLGLFLFAPPEDVWAVLRAILSLDLSGKTVLGGIAGGYLGVEIAKAAVGIRWSTGDGFALALPLGQAIGRFGCLAEGCCFGTPWTGPWAVWVHDTWRHPTPLYEALLDLALAGLVIAARGRVGPPGQLFRLYLVGYAAIRFALDPLRADAAVWWGALTGVQWFTAAMMVGFGTWFAVACARTVVGGER